MQATLRRLQRAVDFVEGHLSDPFTLDDVATAAGLSRYHLHRVFSAVFGDGLKAYVRKRRLTEAARVLRTSDTRIIEVAFAAGFASQEAFTRAFTKLFEATPARYRSDLEARTRPGLLRVDANVLVHRHTGISHEPRIVDRDDTLTVRGRGIGVDFEDDAPVIALWEDLIPSLSAPGTVLYGVTQARHPEIPESPDQSLVYIAGAEPTVWGDREYEVEVTVPPGRYAVFEHHGPVQRIVDTVSYAWASWLPRSEFAKSSRPDLERFSVEQISGDRPHIELWVSIDPRYQT